MKIRKNIITKNKTTAFARDKCVKNFISISNK